MQADEAAALIGHLIGLDFSTSPHLARILADARQLHNRAFHLAGELLRRAAGAEPLGLVLLLGDLRWTPDASLDFFQAAAKAAAADAAVRRAACDWTGTN